MNSTPSMVGVKIMPRVPGREDCAEMRSAAPTWSEHGWIHLHLVVANGDHE